MKKCCCPRTMLTNPMIRALVFLVGCIGTRSALAFLAARASPDILHIMGLVALLPAIGFAYIYVTGSRTTGPEVGGERIWWDGLRPVHSVLYAMFAYHAIRRDKDAWRFLAVDVGIGFLAWALRH